MSNKPELASADMATSAHVQSLPMAGSRNPHKRRLILAVVLLLPLAAVTRMWWHSHYFETTDNAYLAAPVSSISPRIAGVVQKLQVVDNQWVNAGDLLIELDAADQDVKVVQIRAQITQVDEQIHQISEQMKQSHAEAQAAQALVARAKAQLQRDESGARRVSSLREAELKSVSQSELETAIAARDGASADVQAQQYQATAANARSGSIAASRAAAMAQKEVLLAQLRDAELQLGYTRIVAPVSGRIGKKNVELGTRVQAGQQLLAIVQDGLWVSANFKETQLQGLHTGQKARVKIDAFPGQEFTGLVDSFAPASGAQFSLLPPDNATGNFTKIVQRVPVKVVLDPQAVAAMGGRIVPGMSALVEVDLSQGDPAAVAAR